MSRTAVKVKIVANESTQFPRTTWVFLGMNGYAIEVNKAGEHLVGMTRFLAPDDYNICSDEQINQFLLQTSAAKRRRHT